MRKRVYFIRHAEAVHNVAERKAKSDARKTAQATAKHSEEIKASEEKAREQVLLDPAFHDPQLSQDGIRQAKRLQQNLDRLFRCSTQFRPPSLILVSPLERTLQTLLHVFPTDRWNNENVVPMELLREKRTGRPCDERSDLADLECRATYKNMDFTAMYRRGLMSDTDVAQECEGDQDSIVALSVGEGNADVAERAAELLDYIKRSEHTVIAVVTHKAFLRELERGPLKQCWKQVNIPGVTHGEEEGGAEGAPIEFGNAEMRIYDLEYSEET